MSSPPVQTWEQKHAPDFDALHAAMLAVTQLDLSGTTHTDWLTTVRTVRERVNSFSLFIPNAPQLVKLLDTAEKVLLGFKALENLGEG